MTERCDLIVLGGGPAGASAAIEAAALGLDVVLIDEGRDAGGQVYRPPSSALRIIPPSKDRTAGDKLRRQLVASGARSRFARRAWMVERGFRVMSMGPDGPETAEAPALIVATGAQERHIPVPGWTLPGVIGLAAATILLKSDKLLPARRSVVAGCGPLLFLVAATILEGGGEVAAVVDLNARTAWLKALPMMLSRPALAWQGAKWIAAIQARGVPILHRHAVRRIEGSSEVKAAIAGPVDETGRPLPGGELRFEADAVCLGFGLQPTTEATRMLGAAHRFDEALGGWTVVTGRDRATSIPGLYACGDGAGVFGAAAAPLAGRIAALAAARDLGRIDASTFARRAVPLQAAFDKAAWFGGAMATLARPGPGTIGLTTPETILCRCEGLARSTIDHAVAAGSKSLVDLKAATRCGMGPCGGRVCGEAAAMAIAAGTGQPRSQIAPATARPPLRPRPLGLLACQLSYTPPPPLAPGTAVSATYDLAVVGGGIMGCGVALRAAEAGMQTVVLEQSEIGSGASGVNAGTLSLQIKRVKLMPYALKGYALWQAAGDKVGFHRTGGYTLAFTAEEAALLAERVALKREAGAPVDMVSPKRALNAEPALSRQIVAVKPARGRWLRQFQPHRGLLSCAA